MPTIVHTLVSPMSTCHSAPDDADESLLEPRRLDEIDPLAEPALVGRRRPFCDTGFDRLPLLDEPEPRLPFLTRPPSLDGNSDGSGDVGTLLPFAATPPAPK